MKTLIMYVLSTFILTYATHGLLFFLMYHGVIGFYHAGGIFLYSLGGFSPTLFACLFIWRSSDPLKRKLLLQKLFSLRHKLIYWLFSVGVPLLLGLVFLIAYSLGEATEFSLVAPWFMFIYYLAYSILVGGLEEIGWRGYLQENLQHRLNGLLVAGVIGVIWATWHIPLLMIGNFGRPLIDMLPYLLGLFMFNVYLTFLYKMTNSVLLAILFHASINATRRITGFRIILQHNMINYILIGVFIAIGLILLVRADRQTRPF